MALESWFVSKSVASGCRGELAFRHTTRVNHACGGIRAIRSFSAVLSSNSSLRLTKILHANTYEMMSHRGVFAQYFPLSSSACSFNLLLVSTGYDVRCLPAHHEQLVESCPGDSDEPTVGPQSSTASPLSTQPRTNPMPHEVVDRQHCR